MKKLFLILFTIICSLALLNINSIIGAEDGISISPVTKEVDLSPGTSLDSYISVTNSTNEKTSLSLSAEEFNVTNYQYDYNFIKESDISNWVSFQDDLLLLGPNQTKNINYTIGVPLSAEPGGRYISIFVSSDKKFDSDESILRQRLASLIYVNVEGEATRSGSIVSFNSPWLIINQPTWSATLRNSGTTHYRSRYNVNVANLFDKKVSEDKYGEALILPGTIRLITDNFNLPKYPGIYKINYHIGLGDNPAFKQTKIVIYLPYYAIIVLFFALILSIIKIRSKVRKKP